MSTDAVQQLREQGWCVLPGIISRDAVLRGFYDAYRLVATCGVIAPNYAHNMSWQLRALELWEDVLDPSRKDEILAEQFYIRPAVINDAPSFAADLVAPGVIRLLDEMLGPGARVTFTTLYVHEPETKRGPWHSGGPFNPDHAAHYPSPYENAVTHLTAHFVYSNFSEQTGGVLAVAGSHRRPTNPGYEPREKRYKPDPNETTITASAGSVVIMDSRLWHAIAPNKSDFPRVSVVVELAPAAAQLPGFLASASGAKMTRNLFERLPAAAQPLFRQWVQGQ